ncbi:MAG: transcriptional regulator NrdR [Candidatus Margulisbacteria bacterium]|nr:transcriptional regulator NrdR [Candidatus Margulisiibacteriota bacterium]
MKCPFCGSDEDKVLESRTLSEGEAIRRRRECLSCSQRFTSYERLEERPVVVIKSTGNKEFFKKEKILNGMITATEKRPVTVMQIQSVVEEITEELHRRTEREVHSKEIGQMVMDKLQGLDQVAYVRFASVYKQFKDVSEFIKEIKNM